MNFAESKDDLRSVFKRNNVYLNLNIEPLQKNKIVNCKKAINYLKEYGEDAVIKELSKLGTVLVLCESMSNLPTWIHNLSNLNGFIVIGSVSSTLIDEVSQFTQISYLLFLNISIHHIPDTLGNITELQQLYLRYSTIESGELPSSISKLSKLSHLDICGSNIKFIPSDIEKLNSLIHADFSNTLIDELPKSIGNLKLLQSLDISETNISKLPDTISQLSALDRLFLDGLTLDDIPFFENCVKGTDVFCCGFNKNVPFSLKRQPASLFEQSAEIIRQYYSEEKQQINTFKVLFLGHGAAGKTYTVKRLKNDGILQDYDTIQTAGVDIHEKAFSYEGNTINISFWDFGGQDGLYSLHRCFLTERSCYVIVVSNRLHENLQDQAIFWLRIISTRANGVPVVIAINNSENTYSEGVDTEALRKQFPNILIGDSVSYSAKCSSPENFNRLRTAILKQIHNLDSYKMEFPIRWMNIIKEIKNNPNYCIPKQQYYNICERNGVISPEIAKWLLSWFNDLGICFCNHINPETGIELDDYQVSKPDWITTALYRINHAHDVLNRECDYAEEINFDNGTIHFRTLCCLINDNSLGGMSQIKYTPKQVKYIISILRKFLFSCELPSQKKVEFIPVLCNRKRPTNLYAGITGSEIAYYIKYEYLPDSIVHNLMIQLLQSKFNLNAVWLNGFRLEDRHLIAPNDNIYIVVETNTYTESLEIHIWGENPTIRWKWLLSLLNILTKLNHSSRCKTIEEYIEKHKNRQTAHLPISSIIIANNSNHTEIWSTDGGEYESYSLKELIGDTFVEKISDSLIDDNNNIGWLSAYQEAISRIPKQDLICSHSK